VILRHPSTRASAAPSRCLLVARDRSCLTSLVSLAVIAPGLVHWLFVGPVAGPRWSPRRGKGSGTQYRLLTPPSCSADRSAQPVGGPVAPKHKAHRRPVTLPACRSGSFVPHFPRLLGSHRAWARALVVRGSGRWASMVAPAARSSHAGSAPLGYKGYKGQSRYIDYWLVVRHAQPVGGLVAPKHKAHRRPVTLPACRSGSFVPHFPRLLGSHRAWEIGVRHAISITDSSKLLV